VGAQEGRFVIWRYLGAGVGAAAVLARNVDRLVGVAAVLETFATSVAVRVADRLTAVALEATASTAVLDLVAPATPAVAALLLAVAARAAVVARRVISAAVVVLALVTFSGDGSDIAAASVLVAVAVALNMLSGPLLVAPLSALSASLSATSLTWAAVGVGLPRPPTVSSLDTAVGAAVDAALDVAPIVAGAAPSLVVAAVAIAAVAVLLRR
jgi:hypothetical protein